jgi:hypothetical protein
MLRATVFILPLAILAGCSVAPGAPSLAPRAVERQPVDLPLSTPSEPASAADPALAAQIAQIVSDAESGDRTFQQERSRTDDYVKRAKGAGTASEAWIAAQESLSALESARTPVRQAAAAIDAMRQQPANASTGNRGAIEEAAGRVAALEAAEADALATLAAALR